MMSTAIQINNQPKTTNSPYYLGVLYIPNQVVRDRSIDLHRDAKKVQTNRYTTRNSLALLHLKLNHCLAEVQILPEVWYLMLEKISKTGKPILLSSGMSSYIELDKTVDFIKGKGNDVSIFQCTTSYPSESGEWGLKLIPEFIDKYNVPIGFSDHSGNIYACLAAATLGASLLEFHAVFDKGIFGPDAKSSLTIQEIKKMVEGVVQIKNDIGSSNDLKQDNSKFKVVKSIFEKSLAINKDLKRNHIITFDDLEAKKPANKGVSASEFKSVIGKKLNRDINKWDFINLTDLIS